MCTVKSNIWGHKVNEFSELIQRIGTFVPREEIQTMIDLAIAKRMETYESTQQNRHQQNQESIHEIRETISGFKGYVGGVFGVLSVVMTLILHFWK